MYGRARGIIRLRRRMAIPGFGRRRLPWHAKKLAKRLLPLLKGLDLLFSHLLLALLLGGPCAAPLQVRSSPWVGERRLAIVRPDV